MYRYWKAFYVWRKSILFRKYSKTRNKIAKNLFILTPILGKAMLSIQAMCCDMYMKSFADLSRDMDTAFFYFYENQVCTMVQIIYIFSLSILLFYDSNTLLCVCVCNVGSLSYRYGLVFITMIFPYSPILTST